MITHVKFLYVLVERVTLFSFEFAASNGFYQKWKEILFALSTVLINEFVVLIFVIMWS